MHHMDSNKTHRQKVRLELHKNVTCCYEQILEATLHKIAAVRPLTSHHTKHPGKKSKTYWRSKDKVKSDVLPWTPTHRNTSWLISKNLQLCMDTGCCLDDLPRVMANRDRWQEELKGICALSMSS